VNGAEVAAFLRGLIHGDERGRAASIVRAEVRAAREIPERGHFREAMGALARAGGRCAELGESADGTPVLVEESALDRHWLITGATGSGKSVALILALLPLLAEALRGRRAVVVIDPKDEIVHLLVRLLAAHILDMPERSREAALGRIRVIDPFARDGNLPELNLLRSPPGLDEAVYVRQFVGSFAQATAALGIRQSGMLHWIVRLAIEHRIPFPLVPLVLADPYLRAALVDRSSPEVKAYFSTRYGAETHVVRDGLLVRLDEFLALRTTRLVLAAEHMVDFGAAMRGGVTLIGLGSAPGVRQVQSFFALLLTSRVVAALFSRPNSPHQPPATIVADDVGELLLHDIALDLERVLVLMRARRVSLFSTVQEVSQLTAVTPLLARVFLTNVGVWLALRAGPHDEHALSVMLRPTGRRPRPRPLPWDHTHREYFLPLGEEQRLLLEEATQLPRRVGFFWDRDRRWGPIKMRTRTLRIPEEDELPADLLAAVRRGSVAVPASELEDRLRSEEARLRALLRNTVAAGAEAASAGGDPELPRRGRRRRAGLPDLG
jgi:hypothetical protein